MRRMLYRAGQGYPPEDFIVEFPEYKHRTQEILSLSVLFEPDIFAEMAKPYLALVDEGSLYIGVMKLPL